MNTWKTGDTVKLKSGGPIMTVREKEHESDNMITDWFEGPTPRSGSYNPDQLMKITMLSREALTGIVKR